MIVGELLEWAGLPGQIAMLVSAGVALYHFRDVFAMLSTIGFATKVLAFGLFGVFALVVLVPGISVSVAVGTVTEFLGGIIQTVAGLLGVVV